MNKYKISKYMYVNKWVKVSILNTDYTILIILIIIWYILNMDYFLFNLITI